MKPRKKRKRTDHSGSAFDSFLEQEGIREEVETVADQASTRLAAAAEALCSGPVMAWSIRSPFSLFGLEFLVLPPNSQNQSDIAQREDSYD